MLGSFEDCAAAELGDLGDESFQADTKFPQHFPTLHEREGVGARPSGHSVGAEPAEAGAACSAELQTKQNNLLCRPSQLTQQQPSARLDQPALPAINPYYCAPNGKEG